MNKLKALIKELIVSEYGISRKDALMMVGIGWKDLINDLYDAKPKNVNVVLIKEKYAALRFYVAPRYNILFGYGNIPSWYEALIEKCEMKSQITCEGCGMLGHAKKVNGYYITLCDDCYQSRLPVLMVEKKKVD